MAASFASAICYIREMAHITLLARSVISHENQVLLAQAAGQGHAFLPGGHVEQGERAADTLRREIYEEMGLSAEVGDFLGAVEATWGEEPVHHELNLLFRVTLSERFYGMPVPSCEPHLRFFWANLHELPAHNLLPIPLRQLLREQSSGAWWASAVG